MKKLLRYLFKKYYSYFAWLLCEDLIGDIPKDVDDEALKFLGEGRERLSKFFRWYAYVVQRKMQDSKNPDILLGILVNIKMLSVAVERFAPKPQQQKQTQSEKPPQFDLEKELSNVETFRSGKKE